MVFRLYNKMASNANMASYRTFSLYNLHVSFRCFGTFGERLPFPWFSCFLKHGNLVSSCTGCVVPNARHVGSVKAGLQTTAAVCGAACQDDPTCVASTFHVGQCLFHYGFNVHRVVFRNDGAQLFLRVCDFGTY